MDQQQQLEQQRPIARARKSLIHDEIAKRGGSSSSTSSDDDISSGGRHAVATTLRNKEGLIEYYQLYRYPKPKQTQAHSQQPDDQPIAVAIIKVGNLLDGPPAKVHGGIIALLFDDVMGFACVPLLPYAVTRNLAIEYKQPQPHQQYIQIRVFVDDTKKQQQSTTTTTTTPKKKKKKRRLYLKAICSSLGSTTTPESAPFCAPCKDEIVYSTATITMVQVGKATKPSHPLSKL